MPDASESALGFTIMHFHLIAMLVKAYIAYNAVRRVQDSFPPPSTEQVAVDAGGGYIRDPHPSDLVFFRNADITVTGSRIKTQSMSIRVSDVDAVRTFKKGKALPWTLVVLAGLGALGCLLLVQRDLLLTLLLEFACFALAFCNLVYCFTTTTVYGVKVIACDGEILKVFEGADEKRAERIAYAICDAMELW